MGQKSEAVLSWLEQDKDAGKEPDQVVMLSARSGFGDELSSGLLGAYFWTKTAYTVGRVSWPSATVGWWTD